MPNERPTLEDLRVKFEKLDAKLKASNEDHPLRRRLRRSMSWLERADSGKLDGDVRYIFLWVAFNAAYADDRDARGARRVAEWERYKKYFEKLTENDKYRIHNILECELMDSSLSLVENKYVFREFWNFLDDGCFSEDEWRESQEGRTFESDCRRMKKLFGFDDQSGSIQEAFRKVGIVDRDDTICILYILFGRLNVLRNQIMHGSATSHTWTDTKRIESRKQSTPTEDSSLNRSQVEDGVRILGHLVPLFLDIMMNHHKMDQEEYWGKLPYPVRFDIREDRRK